MTNIIGLDGKAVDSASVKEETPPMRKFVIETDSGTYTETGYLIVSGDFVLIGDESGQVGLCVPVGRLRCVRNESQQ